MSWAVIWRKLLIVFARIWKRGTVECFRASVREKKKHQPLHIRCDGNTRWNLLNQWRSHSCLRAFKHTQSATINMQNDSIKSPVMMLLFFFAFAFSFSIFFFLQFDFIHWLCTYELYGCSLLYKVDWFEWWILHIFTPCNEFLLLDFLFPIIYDIYW